MKTAISSWLAVIGLAPLGQVERLSAEAEKAADRIKQLENRVATLRAEAESWKRRCEETGHLAGESKHAAAIAAVNTERAMAEVGRARAEAARALTDISRKQNKINAWKARGRRLQDRVIELRARLEDSQRTTTIAREQLMAMETKLDLVEAAIQVLDARTRDGLLSRPTEHALDRHAPEPAESALVGVEDPMTR